MEYKVYRNRKAAFLDRDGVIVERKNHYLTSIDDVNIIGENLLHDLQEEGYLLIVISNQSAVGRGIISRDTAWDINDYIERQLHMSGVFLDAIFICPHRPGDACRCRKPKPMMIEDAARYLGVDLSESVMIGDEDTDIEAGARAGVGTTIQVDTNHPDQALMSEWG